MAEDLLVDPEALRDQVLDTFRGVAVDHVELREGLAETMPVDGWADAVISSNGVINLRADKRRCPRNPPCAGRPFTGRVRERRPAVGWPGRRHPRRW